MLPTAKEAIEGADDLPWNIESILSEFEGEFPNLCTSHFDKYENRVNYFFEDLEEPLKAELIAKIKSDDWNQAGKVYQIKLDCNLENFEFKTFTRIKWHL